MIYAAKVYSNYITRQKLNIYSSSVIKLPVPKCICFYNGPTDSEDSQVFKLSDSFDNKGESDIEVSVTMYNINTGHNTELLNSCRPLAEYSEFVNNVRKYDQSGYNLSTAINKAIDAIPDEAMIKTVMEENRLEVTGMCIEEYTQEWADIVIKKEMDELKDQNQELTEENRGLTEEIKRVESERSKAIEILRSIGVSDESIRKAYGSVD